MWNSISQRVQFLLELWFSDGAKQQRDDSLLSEFDHLSSCATWSSVAALSSVAPCAPAEQVVVAETS